MKIASLFIALLFFSGCSKSTSMRGFNEINEVATSLFRNNTEALGYTIISEGGGSSTTSGTARYKIYERSADYPSVRASVFSRIEEEVRRKGFSIHGWGSYGDLARSWEFTGLGIHGTLRVDFTDGSKGEFATLLFVAVRKNEN